MQELTISQVRHLSGYLEKIRRLEGLGRYVADIYGPRADVVGIVHRKGYPFWEDGPVYEIEVYDQVGVRCQPDLSLPYWQQAMQQYPDAWEGAYTQKQKEAAAVAYLYKYQVVPEEYPVYYEQGWHRLPLPRFESIRLYTETPYTPPHLYVESYRDRPEGCHA